MTQTLTGLFDHYDDARRAVQDLEAAGVAHRDISIVVAVIGAIVVLWIYHAATGRRAL